jgi:hypothetical protein
MKFFQSSQAKSMLQPIWSDSIPRRCSECFRCIHKTTVRYQLGLLTRRSLQILWTIRHEAFHGWKRSSAERIIENYNWSAWWVERFQNKTWAKQTPIKFTGIKGPNSLFVDGKCKKTDNKFYYYSSGTETPALSTLKFAPQNSLCESLTVNCLGNGNGFSFRGQVPNSTFWFICEARRPV